MPAELREQLRRIIFQMDTHRPWVLKDPRLCLTFPVWRPLLDVPVCVLPYRSPLAIARSLQSRNGLGLLQGIALWEQYTLAALAASKDLPRLVVSYEKLILDPKGVVSELYEGLCAMELMGLRKPSKREITAFIETRLQHQPGLLAGYEGLLNSSQRQLAEALEDGLALEWDTVPPLSAGAREVLVENRRRIDHENKLTRTVDGVQEELANTHAKLESALGELNAMRVESERERGKAAEELANTQARLESTSGEVGALRVEFEEELAKNHGRLENALEVSVVLRLECEQLRTSCQAKDEQVVFLAGELELLTSWIAEIDQSFMATLASWRWRLGHGAVSLVERVLFRRQVMLGVDHIRTLLDRYRGWIVQSRSLSLPSNAFQSAQAPKAISYQQVTGAPSAEPRSVHPSVANYDFICLANIDWDARYQRPQQLANQFARHGHRVFYLISSRSLPPGDSQGFRARNVAENIFEVELMANKEIDRYASVLDTEDTEYFCQSIERLREAFNIVDAVCHVHLAFWVPVAFKLRAIWSWPVIYDCMDEWEDFPGIGKPLLVAERTLIRDSDAVTVTAALLEEKYCAHNPRCVLVRNGVDFEFFHFNCQPSQILGDMSHPIIGFYGALAEWVDVGLIAEVARAQPDWNFVIVGDIFIPKLEGLDQLSNVHLLGRRPYEDMPRYLYHFDACLIPFRLNQVTHAVDPVKLYEFISAGKPVIAVPLQELAIYANYLYFATTSDEFVREIKVALSENDLALRQSRIDLARNNDWYHRYQLISELILKIYRRVSIIVVTYKNIDLSRLCIESVIRNTTYPNYELIVIDNDSRDGTANYLYYMAERYERINILINQKNLGFAAANNQGLAMSTGDYLILLNNDTVTPRGWLAPMLNHLRDKQIGLVGPVTNFVGNEAKIDVPYHNLDGMEQFAREYMSAHAGKIFDIKVLAMFCVAMRRDIYREVGLLDENFGIGMFEDDDYSNRIKQKGYRVVCAEDSFVHHFGQAAFKKLLESGEYHQIWSANQAYYEQKWGKWESHKLRKDS